MRARSDAPGWQLENRRRVSEGKLLDVPQDEGGALAGIDSPERLADALRDVRAIKQRIEFGSLVRRDHEGTIAVERGKEALE